MYHIVLYDLLYIMPAPDFWSCMWGVYIYIYVLIYTYRNVNIFIFDTRSFGAVSVQRTRSQPPGESQQWNHCTGGLILGQTKRCDCMWMGTLSSWVACCNDTHDSWLYIIMYVYAYIYIYIFVCDTWFLSICTDHSNWIPSPQLTLTLPKPFFNGKKTSLKKF